MYEFDLQIVTCWYWFQRHAPKMVASNFKPATTETVNNTTARQEPRDIGDTTNHQAISGIWTAQSRDKLVCLSTTRRRLCSGTLLSPEFRVQSLPLPSFDWLHSGGRAPLRPTEVEC
ncbi:hypothetical protein ACJ72_07123 [Emergomyces africanus]|uniref:Uncharacterized protein n=1 Tax=Emergomyces africanus TaxID=1955775 RepID=A0A1B7NP68_9EURO|nr:hypothetical protein ACJ72_07123 [Emergomyces africanus]